MIGFVVVAFSAGALLLNWSDLADGAKFLMDILSSVLLPVVTLVIGYYFGKEK